VAAIVDFIRRSVRTSGVNPAVLTAPASTYYGPTTLAPTSYSINDDRALSLTAVYRAVVVISTKAASLPLHIYMKNEDGTRERFEAESTRFIWDRPNPEMSAQTFWEMVIGHEVMGDAFIWVAKNGAGEPLQLWPIEPARVRVGRTADKRKVYEIDGELPMLDFAAGGEIVHVPNWSRGNLRGVSPVQLAANALSLGMSAQAYAERFYSQSTVPQGIISTDADLTQDEAETLAAIWSAQRSGLQNAHRDAVLSSGAKYQAVSISPADAQLLEERSFTVAEVSRIFGVPPHMLYDLERSTSWGTGIEAQSRGFLTDTLQAHLVRFEQAINYALLGQDASTYAKFSLDAFLRATTAERYQAYALGYGRWLSTNDIRRLEDMPPVDGGDDVLAALNLVPLEMLGDGNVAPAPAPMAAPADNSNGSRPAA
jgi:HK97 family phage portal protein